MCSVVIACVHTILYMLHYIIYVCCVYHYKMMSVDDFTTMLAYLVRVSWAAAAGQLHLASAEESYPPTPSKDVKAPLDSSSMGRRLVSGICAAQTDVSSKVW